MAMDYFIPCYGIQGLVLFHSHMQSSGYCHFYDDCIKVKWWPIGFTIDSPILPHIMQAVGIKSQNEPHHTNLWYLLQHPE